MCILHTAAEGVRVSSGYNTPCGERTAASGPVSRGGCCGGGGGGRVRTRAMSQPPSPARGRFDVRTGPHGPRGF